MSQITSSAASRQIGKWLRKIVWQWSVTLTFPIPHRAETADRKLKLWANLLERTYRTHICYAAAREAKHTISGVRVSWHFHLLLTSKAQISSSSIGSAWKHVSGGKTPEHAMVTRYDETKHGPEYCFKAINEQLNEWDFHRLEHFLPNIIGTDRPSHRSVRAAKRSQSPPPRIKS